MATNTELTPNLGPAERAYVFAVAMKYVKNESEAEDVTQDAMLLAHRHRNSFCGRSRYSTWLYRVAASAALMHMRKARRRGGRKVCLEDIVGHRESADVAPTPFELASAREELGLAGLAARMLKPKYRDVFELRFGHGKTDAEVADALGLTLTAAKTRAFRARAQVRERLGA